MYEQCSPTFFYTKLRIFLAGWKNNKSLPDGIIYEGVSSKPFKFSGASASQSTTFHLFDAALGITHQDGEKTYLESMLDYMPRGHRQFVQEIRKGPSIRDYVLKSEDGELLRLYDDCVESLVQFRSLHIQVVTSYVTIQAANAKNKLDRALVHHGTGGTEYMSFLKHVRDETNDAKMI
ncbi:indoleamine 2,3-dioxygenase 2-like [Dendronephthya gigantea]|uniref:indoleamine 2,3-dioxygenase 2-like n=1 Tax=Dendronephthya gigantea TaxID=151771 RepID=UPI00106C71D4|nr:indoleamine 2,3-dioxygenase 2-like [Dendronephthya gigantea]